MKITLKNGLVVTGDSLDEIASRLHTLGIENIVLYQKVIKPIPELVVKGEILEVEE